MTHRLPRLRHLVRGLWLTVLGLLFLGSFAMSWGLAGGTAAGDELAVSPKLRSAAVPYRGWWPSSTLTREQLDRIPQLTLANVDDPDWPVLPYCHGLRLLYVGTFYTGRPAADVPVEARPRVDLALLAAMPLLSEVGFSDMAIPSLEPLVRLPQLDTVNLYRCTTGDLAPLTRCTRLRELVITGRRYRPGKVWITPLDNHDADRNVTLMALPQSLESLALSGMPLDNLDFLPRLSHLKILDLGLTRITSVEALTELPNLEIVYLDHDNLTDYSALLRCPSLKNIWISVSDPSPDAALVEALRMRGASILTVDDFPKPRVGNRP